MELEANAVSANFGLRCMRFPGQNREWLRPCHRKFRGFTSFKPTSMLCLVISTRRFFSGDVADAEHAGGVGIVARLKS